MLQSTPKHPAKLLPKPVRFLPWESTIKELISSSHESNMQTPFTLGLEVRFDRSNTESFYGTLRYISVYYVTLCINESDKIGGCCMVIYPVDFSKIIPLSSIRQRQNQ